MNDYFLGTILPDINFEEKPEITLKEYFQLMRDNLSQRDYEKIIRVRYFYDIANLLAYWKGMPFDPIGNLDFGELEEALVTRLGLPDYVYEYIDRYKTLEEKIVHYPELLSLYYRQELAQANGPIKVFLTLERDLRLILVALRAKKLKRDVAGELQYENPEDPLVAQILEQRANEGYEPPEEYAPLKKIFLDYSDEPMALHKAVQKYKFDKINEILNLDFFSINRFVGYLIQLIIVEKWQHLNKTQGEETLRAMLKETP